MTDTRTTQEIVRDTERIDRFTEALRASRKELAAAYEVARTQGVPCIEQAGTADCLTWSTKELVRHTERLDRTRKALRRSRDEFTSALDSQERFKAKSAEATDAAHEVGGVKAAIRAARETLEWERHWDFAVKQCRETFQSRLEAAQRVRDGQTDVLIPFPGEKPRRI